MLTIFLILLSISSLAAENISSLIDLESMQTELIQVNSAPLPDETEIIQRYQSHPETLTEEELLQMAARAADLQSAIDFYQSTLTYYPQSATALLNLSTLLIRQGKPEKAITLLEDKQDLNQSVLINLATAYAQTGQTSRAEAILVPINTPQARYNLGVIKAANGENDEAIELFGNTADTNAAIAALAANQTEQAAALISATSDQSPRAEYVRAIIAACTGNTPAFKRHLEALSEDFALQERALTDPEFAPMLQFKE